MKECFGNLLIVTPTLIDEYPCLEMFRNQLKRNLIIVKFTSEDSICDMLLVIDNYTEIDYFFILHSKTKKILHRSKTKFDDRQKIYFSINRRFFSIKYADHNQGYDEELRMFTLKALRKNNAVRYIKLLYLKMVLIKLIN